MRRQSNGKVPGSYPKALKMESYLPPGGVFLHSTGQEPKVLPKWKDLAQEVRFLSLSQRDKEDSHAFPR
jgi:hypothetical protein